MTPPASRHREPHQAADLRGEGMTSSPFDGCGRRDTGIDESNAPHPPNPRKAQTTFSVAHAAPNGAGVKALRPLRGRATPEP
jgi:hypothetical protein